MAVFLETERMELRAITENDADNLHRLDNEPAVMRFLNGGRPTSREVIKYRILPRVMREYPCLGLPGLWAADEKTTREFLGWFAFRPLKEDNPAEVELGYRLRSAVWSNG